MHPSNWRPSLLWLLVCLVVGGATTERPRGAGAQPAASVPNFHVDATWPQTLPNHWIVGQIGGVAVDSHDHIWVYQRPSSLTNFEKAATTVPPSNECCVPAPPVLEFDRQGKLLRHWGGPGTGYDWPASEHGIFVDRQDNVWLGGNSAKDAQLLKFTADGKFLMQIGHPGQSKGSNDTENLGRPAEIFVDTPAKEVYVADGYGNRRVIVFDSETGQYKRHWGAYGRKPDDTPRGRFDPATPPLDQFRTPVHCVVVSKDGFVYVCDRENNRIQEFKKDGTFIREVILGQNLHEGAACGASLSTDPDQQFLYVVDVGNMKVRIVRRKTFEVVGSFGSGGHNAGQFITPHSIAVDSAGSLYIGEVDQGKRVQRFVQRQTGNQAR